LEQKWTVLQRHVYQRQIYSMDELKLRFIDVRCGHEQSIFDHWRGRLRACPCMLKEDTRHTTSIQLVNWQCWFNLYLLHTMWLVWLLHF